MSSGIYKIINIYNNKCYIGSSINLQRRKRNHFSYLNRQKHPNKHLQSSFNKYGKENFIFEIIEQCENLIEREQYYIDTLKPEYNKRIIAETNLGSKFSDQAKLNMSIAMTGEGNSFYNKKHSDESKLKMRNAKLGKKLKKSKVYTIKVSKYSLNDEYIQTYDSLKIAALENNLPYKWFIETICKNPEYRGFKWFKHKHMKNSNKNILTLDKISKKDKSESSKEVSDVLLLLQSGERSEELDMLKKIGLDTHIRAAENAKTNIQRFTALEQKFGRNVYSAEQVKEYCQKEGYQIVRVDRFKHQVPVIVGEEIIKFNNENKRSHQRNEDRVVEVSEINLNTSNFFLLTSIQSMKGAPVKAATLFYRGEYRNDHLETINERDMLVEVCSWGVPGNDRSLLWEYIKATDGFLLFPVIFLVIGILVNIFGSSAHVLMLFLWLVSVVAILLISKKSFFKWNSN